jgi:hypothetical protein
MSMIKTNKNGSNFIGNQVINTENKSRSFYQYFSAYLMAIFLFVIVALSSGLFILFQQTKSSQALITEQLLPLQAKFFQQAYLINTNKLIDDILQNSNVHDFISLQQGLFLQSEKLSSLNPQYKTTYPQWFRNNIKTTNLITAIKSNHEDNELLKNKILIQLDTLLDGIKIQLRNLQTTSDHAILLSQVERELANLVVKFNPLNLRTPLEVFEQLHNQIDTFLITDYSKKLANQQYESQKRADIVRDLIRFEDILLKSKILSKWQNNLQLMHDYQQQLVAQQLQLNNIFDDLLHHKKSKNSSNSDDVTTNAQTISASQLPLWVFILFSLTLICVAGLLWLTLQRIKSLSKQAATFVEQTLNNEGASLVTDENGNVYGAEFERLAKKIQDINSRHYSELEFLTLTDKYQDLEEKIIKANVNKEQLKRELELVEFNAFSKSESQLLLEQQRCKALYVGALKQLVLLGSGAVTTISTDNEDSVSAQSNYLYYAHLQGRDLVRKLRQASCYRYLQSSDAVLTLSDINLVAHIQGILLNLSNKLFICKNKILLTIDDKILSEVNLDAELFSELLRVFIRQLFSQQTDIQLILSLKLIDKNNGQQKISFRGEIQSKDQTVQLPESLQAFNDESEKQSELNDYFNTLLRYQHGEDINREVTDNGYQLSFTLPVAITRNQQDKNDPIQSFPYHLADIEKICVKLSAKYISMPIEVLLAVKSPEKYQRLQQLLHSMGLQITFVTCERMLQKSWRSGRFVVLMTELDCQPFTTFIINENEQPSDRVTLARGIFDLASSVDISQKAAEYSHWITGQLNAQSAVSELTRVLRPWIKEQESESVLFNKVIGANVIEKHINAEPLAEKSSAIFNVERYIKHQGSTELAIFMLQEYTAENTLLIERLDLEFMDNNTDEVEKTIHKLLVNSKILAAEHLINLCQCWQKVLSTQGLDNSDKVQISLLSKSKEAVLGISKYADTIA